MRLFTIAIVSMVSIAGRVHSDQTLYIPHSYMDPSRETLNLTIGEDVCFGEQQVSPRGLLEVLKDKKQTDEGWGYSIVYEYHQGSKNIKLLIESIKLSWSSNLPVQFFLACDSNGAKEGLRSVRLRTSSRVEDPNRLSIGEKGNILYNNQNVNRKKMFEILTNNEVKNSNMILLVDKKNLNNKTDFLWIIDVISLLNQVDSRGEARFHYKIELK